MYVIRIRYFISGFGAGSKMIDPHVSLAMLFNFIYSSSHLQMYIIEIPSVYYGIVTLHVFSYVCHTMYIVI